MKGVVALISSLVMATNLFASDNACEKFVPVDVKADHMTIDGNCFILNDVPLSDLSFKESKTLHIAELGGLVLSIKQGNDVALLIDEDLFYVLDPSNEGVTSTLFSITGLTISIGGYFSSQSSERRAEEFRSEQRERQRSADRQESVDSGFRRIEEAARNLPKNHDPIQLRLSIPK